MRQDDVQQPSRRRVLGILGGLGVVAIAGCGDNASDAATPVTTPTTTGGGSTSITGAAAGTASTTTTAPPSATAVASCTKIPEETAGPYPGDGTNGPNVLTQSGVVRSDIRSSFGSSNTVAKGLPLSVVLTIVDKSSCKPIPGAAVYLWHCDVNGAYSMYSQGVTNENFLRGVQEADSKGQLTFSTIYPGAYPGRWPHIHFEVFSSLSVATNGKNKKATSQLALPEDICKLVYATSGYTQSAKNFPQTSLKNDNVFSDGWTTQTPVVTGDVTTGYVARLDVGV